MFASMDRDAIARGQRRRQAEEALEVERDRMAMLEEQIEDLVTGLIGNQVDEAAFATMAPEDVETVRALVDPRPEYDLDDEWPAAEDEAAEGEAAAAHPETEAEDATAEIEAEVSRLESEIAISRQRQQALERYVAALDESDVRQRQA
jgi:predicted  nucleic acid-binding Zn-ribbon protein